MKQFIAATDVADMPALIGKALAYKTDPLKDKLLGSGKRVGLLFLNPSLRTRLSTQVAAANLGMEAIVFNVDKEGWALEFAEGAVMNGNTVEHVKDAAPVLGQYFDVLCLRTFPSLQNRAADYSEHLISQFIRYAGVPVMSLESATLHPLQSLADLITITEDSAVRSITRKPKVVLSWAPHIKPLPQCVANSFAQWMTAWGAADFVVCQPEGYELDPVYTNGAAVMHHQEEAFAGADYVYVKNWSSYNQYGQMPAVSGNWMPDLELWQQTNEARLMHCLPVRRNVELSDELLDSSYSLVTKQAGNRVWSAQAVLSELIK